MRYFAMAGGFLELDWKTGYSSDCDDILRDFYISALSRSVRYDREAGFFSSTALSVAAAGLARFIENVEAYPADRPAMRLLVGCILSEEDIKTLADAGDPDRLGRMVERQLLRDFGDPVDWIQRQRLQALAWLVAVGHLEVRVAVPTDNGGRPLPGGIHESLFHTKIGILTDTQGNRIAFKGSVNESAQAWLKNIEDFDVYTSWGMGGQYLEAAARKFQLRWEGQTRHLRVLPLPQALREQLLQYAPAEPLRRDPLEPSQEIPEIAAEDWKERVLLQFLRDAPFMPNATHIGTATAWVSPWPHQQRVVEKLVTTFPARYLLCDEVGLGKTIEAGLVIRELLLSGLVRRCLILVPRGVVIQWHEELREKFNLYPYRYTGKDFKVICPEAPGEEKVETVPLREGSSPFDQHDFILATSHLVKRKGRQHELLGAERDWDLIILDEAHHARRKSPTDETRDAANHLLRFMRHLQRRTKGLLLLTATPMQIDPVEVWDLLTLLGLGGLWGADGALFRDFYRHLRALQDGTADLDFLCQMVADYLDQGGRLDESLRSAMDAQDPVLWRTLTDAIRDRAMRRQLAVHRQPGERWARVYQFFQRNTPLRAYMVRNTRELLRKYHQAGLLKERVPVRKVVDEPFISMSPEERALYEEIEEYLNDRYQQEGETRRGIGFILTIYCRRLTSSLYAIRQSLERRRDYLRTEGREGTPDGLTEEDREEAEIELDVEEEAVATDPAREAELVYLDDFIGRIAALGTDTKLAQLQRDLGKYFNRHAKAVLFTQYTDTLDYLRDSLRQVYGHRVACYSSRGGEVWNGTAWQRVTKEEIKQLFREGDRDILLCTDAASEGLNLQTCGLLINYDMPWNPMRVEQRIGRIDRIGQVFPEIEVRNYFYAETVEAEIYSRLGARIHWFEWVVGDLQPILAQLPRAIERAAMSPRAQRRQTIDELVEELNRQLDEFQQSGLRLDDYLDPAFAPTAITAPGSPVSPAELYAVLSECPRLMHRFRLNPGPKLTLRWSMDDREVCATADRDHFDQHSDHLRFLSYGDPEVERLIHSSPPMAECHTGGPIVRVMVEGYGVRRVHYFWVPDGQTAQTISSAAALLRMANEGQSLPPPAPELVAEVVERERAALLAFLEAEEGARKGVAQRREESRRRGITEILKMKLRRLLEIEHALDVRTKRLDLPEESQIELLATLQEKHRNDSLIIEVYQALKRPASVCQTEARAVRKLLDRKSESLKGELSSLREDMRSLLARVGIGDIET